MIFIPICNLIKNLLQKGLTVALNDNFNLMSLTGCYKKLFKSGIHFGHGQGRLPEKNSSMGTARANFGRPGKLEALSSGNAQSSPDHWFVLFRSFFFFFNMQNMNL